MTGFVPICNGSLKKAIVIYNADINKIALLFIIYYLLFFLHHFLSYQRPWLLMFYVYICECVEIKIKKEKKEEKKKRKKGHGFWGL